MILEPHAEGNGLDPRTKTGAYERRDRIGDDIRSRPGRSRTDPVHRPRMPGWPALVRPHDDPARAATAACVARLLVTGLPPEDARAHPPRRCRVPGRPAGTHRASTRWFLRKSRSGRESRYRRRQGGRSKGGKARCPHGRLGPPGACWLHSGTSCGYRATEVTAVNVLPGSRNSLIVPWPTRSVRGVEPGEHDRPGRNVVWAHMSQGNSA